MEGLNGGGRVKTFAAETDEPEIVFLLSGQGAQYENMGIGLYREVKVFREEVDRCFGIAGSLTGEDLKAGTAFLMETDAPLVVFVFVYALARLLMKWGVRPTAMTGYSMGEYIAAVLSGAISLEDALKIVTARKDLLEKTKPGSMLSVPLPWQELEPLLEDGIEVYPAILNGPTTVLAGTKEAIGQLERQMKAKRLLCAPIAIPHAIHSPLMEPVRREFEEIAGGCALSAPQIPYISNVSGAWISEEEAVDPGYWAKHLCSTVRFSEGIEELLKQENTVFIEIGPGRLLSNIVRHHLQEERDRSHRIVNIVKHQQEKAADFDYLLNKIGEMWLYGVSLDWDAFYEDRRERPARVPLPGYPFERERYWIDEDPFNGIVQRPGQPGEQAAVAETVPAPASVPHKDHRADAPLGEMEQAIARLWRRFLGFEFIGRERDFFDINGDSITATQLVTRIQQLYPVEISLQQFFETPTIAGQAKLIEQLLKDKMIEFSRQRAGIPKRAVFSPVPLSYTQQRLWVLDRLVPGNPFYNVPRAFSLNGAVDIPLFEQALNEIVRRHESLRTIFTTDAESGEPVQVILPQLKIEARTMDLQSMEPKERSRETQRRTEAEAARPFDLERGPLLRVTLLQLSGQEHVLLFTMHHIISDGWSVNVFMGELERLYDAFSNGKPSPLPDPGLQYPDFAMWQREWMQGEVLEKQLSFWKDILSGDLPILELPTDHQRPAVPTYKGGMLDFQLDAGAGSALSELARREKCSLFQVLLAAFSVLLYRYTGQEDILVGAPIANRNRAEVEEMIGFFANTIVFRTDISGTPTFIELLNRVNTVTTAAYDNQDLPFEKLVEEFQPDRYMSHTPFFQVMFNYESENPAAAKEEDTGTPGLRIGLYPVHNKTSKFDLWLTMSTRDNAPGGGVEYNTDIFDEHTIRRFIAHFKTVLDAVAAEPVQRVHHLPLMPEEERREILETWNDTSVQYEFRCLHYMFEDQAARTPQNTALALPRQVTYDRLNREANRLAHRLTASGVKPGAPVGLFLDRSVEMVTALLGVMKAGAAYLPLDPEYPLERLAYMIKDSAIDMILATHSLTSNLPPFNGAIIHPDTLNEDESPETNPQSGMVPEDLAYVIYTSGSTGKPKGVAVPHKGVCNRLLWIQDNYPIDPSDRLLQKTPYSFDVSVWEFFWPLLNGATLVMAKPGGHKDSTYLVNIIHEQRITIMHFVPAMMNVFLEDPALQPDKVSTLRMVISSGEALPADYRDRFFLRFGPNVRLLNLYGPTEASIEVTHWECLPGSARHSVPIGKPIANTQIYILDKHHNPVPTGVHGQIHIAGAQLAHGYLNQPALTRGHFAKLLSGGILYKTGDLGRWLSGGVVEYIGRLDHQVKVRGFRIELGEIESYLREHEALEDAVAIAREDNPGEGKQLAAYVVPNNAYWQRQQNGESEFGDEQVDDWQEVFDEAYREEGGHQDPFFNISGWNSSYTGEPIPAEEMRLWVDHTVERILSLKAERIMEIGCGTGLFLFPIIPRCRYYLGADIAKQGLDYIRKHLPPTGTGAEVELLHRPARQFDGIREHKLDLIFLNSVVQYFPSADYLVDVMEQAASALEPGGGIFIGDVRSLPLLETFHASVEYSKAGNDTGPEQLYRRVKKAAALEQELVIDPAFFAALQEHIPAISNVQLLLKHGPYSNELSNFRYDVILHIGDKNRPANGAAEKTSLHWPEHKTTPAQALVLLRENEPEILALTGVPNSRTAADVQILKQLTGKTNNVPPVAVDPEDYRRLTEEAPYHVFIALSAAGPHAFDVIFLHHRLETGPPATWLPPSQGNDWNLYTTHPLLVKASGKLAPELRQYLKERLPEYMVPGHIVLLERMPLTASGKLDRKSLPEPLLDLQLAGDQWLEPAAGNEKLFARIWSEVLHLEKISAAANFFALGGDSIKAIQVVSRANGEGFKLTVQDLYRNQDIAQLARAAGESAPGEEEEEMALTVEVDKEILYRHLPPGTEIEDVLPVTPHQKHMLELLDDFSRYDPGAFQVSKLYLPRHMPVNVSLLKEVLAQVTAHRQVLRSVFVREDLDEPVQVICAQGEVPLLYYDWSGLSEHEYEPRLEELLEEEWRNSIDRRKPVAVRMVLIKRAEENYQYFFTCDYIRFDGWGFRMVQDEIANCYFAREMGLDLELEKEDQYKHYLAALRKQDITAAQSYWRAVFTGYKAPGSLLQNLAGNAEGTAKGFARQHIYYSFETTCAIDDFLQRHQLVYSTLVFAAWAMILSAYSGQEDIVFGSIYSGRSATVVPGIETLMGNTMNVLPVRIKVEKDESILDWMKQIFLRQSDTNRYEYASVDSVKKWAGIPPDMPLFETYLAIQNLPEPDFRDIVGDEQYAQIPEGALPGADRKYAGELTDEQKEFEHVFARMEYPFRIDVYMPTQLCLVFNYDRRVLADSAVKGIIENIEVLIEQIIKDPGNSTGELLSRINPDKYPVPQKLEVHHV
jgi:amino acid adenylation domain-containing protein